MWLLFSRGRSSRGRRAYNPRAIFECVFTDVGQDGGWGMGPYGNVEVELVC